MKIVENVCTDIEDRWTYVKKVRKIRRKKPEMGLYLVTLPLFDYGLMEVYSFNELLQKYYREFDRGKLAYEPYDENKKGSYKKNNKNNIVVIGISQSKDGAKELVSEILEKTAILSDDNNNLSTDIGLNIRKYFGVEEC